MKSFIRPLLSASVILVLAACSTPQSRIADHKTAYDNLPPDMQQKVSAGQVEVGFTEEMVLMALGEPDRRYSHKTETGDTEVWGYEDHHPRVSIGLGFGSFGRHSAVGGAVGLSDVGGYNPGDRTRVEFRGGHVVAVDHVGR